MFGLEIDIAGVVNAIVDFIVKHLGGFLRAISSGIEKGFEAIVDALSWPPAIVVILALVAVVWLVTRSWKLSLGSFIGLCLIPMMSLWPYALDTLVLVLFSTAVSLLFAIPIGIMMGISQKVATIMKPVLDLMQTMPSFVYLIPAVMLFGVGKVPAMFATMIFAMPPAIRLTYLGIQEVSGEVKEAAISYGATRKQLLFDVQLPLAVPTIMAGINQCIMLALSMAVIASMIGAAGLGNEVLRSISRLDVGYGFEAGISIVFLAIILDRVTNAIHKRTELQGTKREEAQA
ncbi:MAG: ABC transporter permease subunit [Dehalococcoidales bacterium]|jgi:glycine betaine/proline transport system permease protein|nr:ABC transporter permease subunit [Dehalococcoidales bacterium]MDD4230278.1 ABC transporter permease subunit [Dehalococcoidales bacterium]MDD4465383.1 ABC transporter permease subunit [Dehalococcoidales bacterium]MDD5402437.1 ABC transporter permease subunit [Dehalococcoidales bacterium]